MSDDRREEFRSRGKTRNQITLRKTSVFKAYDFKATEDGLPCIGVAPQYIKSGYREQITSLRLCGCGKRLSGYEIPDYDFLCKSFFERNLRTGSS
jgi:hypothetical protein